MVFPCVSATDCVSDVGPASVIVGNLVQGNRLACAQGRDVGGLQEEEDSSKKVSSFKDISNKFDTTRNTNLFPILC